MIFVCGFLWIFGRWTWIFREDIMETLLWRDNTGERLDKNYRMMSVIVFVNYLFTSENWYCKNSETAKHPLRQRNPQIHYNYWKYVPVVKKNPILTFLILPGYGGPSLLKTSRVGDLHISKSCRVWISDILVLKLISVLVFILFSIQNFYFFLVLFFWINDNSSFYIVFWYDFSFYFI